MLQTGLVVKIVRFAASPTFVVRVLTVGPQFKAPPTSRRLKSTNMRMSLSVMNPKVSFGLLGRLIGLVVILVLG